MPERKKQIRPLRQTRVPVTAPSNQQQQQTKKPRIPRVTPSNQQQQQQTKKPRTPRAAPSNQQQQQQTKKPRAPRAAAPTRLQRGKGFMDASRSIGDIAPACTNSITNMQRIIPGGNQYMSVPGSSSNFNSMYKNLSPSTASSLNSHVVNFGTFSSDATYPSHLQKFQPPLQIGYAKKPKAASTKNTKRSNCK